MTPTFKGLGSALAKLKHDLDLQAGPLMADIEQLASTAPGLLKQAQQEVAKTKQAVNDIREFVDGLTGSNGGPTIEASPASQDSSVASAAAPQAAQAAPEQATVNGVSVTG